MAQGLKPYVLKLMFSWRLLTGIVFLLINIGCSDPKITKAPVTPDSSPAKKEVNIFDTLVKIPKDPGEFIPNGFILFDIVSGDLNTDSIPDFVLIIKGTESSRVVIDDDRGILDRNRRGLIILFAKNEGFEMALKNLDCFSSENEDGGVYYAPELEIEIANRNLYVHYAHGRYGFWRYTFRYQNSDFELIGYDNSNNTGPVINTETRINYLTKKKIIRENTNENAEGGDEVFKVTETKIATKKHLKLSQIVDFDILGIPEK